jgi:preprotein translocase subunit SecB
MTKKKDAKEQTETQEQQPQLVIHTQYIKDFSFENPNSPKVLIEKDGQPDIEINVNVSANPQPQERLFEVVLHIRASAKRNESTMFIAELSYAAIIQVGDSVDEKTLHPIVMIEGPRLIFPFARAILAEVTQAGGFMPLNIQPIDFVRVYQNGMESTAGND